VLIGLGAFVLFVGALWWGLGFNKPPIPDIKLTPRQNIQIPEIQELKMPPELPGILLPPKSVTQTGTTETTKGTTETTKTGTTETTKTGTTETTGTPGTTVAQVSGPRPKPFPPKWLPDIRAELSRCSNFFCTKTVQKKYCDGYWNRLRECKDTLRQ
jgi:hypothetical protein